MAIENTSERNPLVHLVGVASEGQGSYIQNMEKAGQRQLLASDRLPVRLVRGTDADFESFGFTFGPPDPADPLFRPAKMPPGWRREASADNDMWSYLVDEHGRRRGEVFYKAAWYDRRADMRLVNPHHYLREVIDHPTKNPVIDEQWLTPQIAVEMLATMRDEQNRLADNAKDLSARISHDEFWSQQRALYLRRARRAQELIDSLTAAAEPKTT